MTAQQNIGIRIVILLLWQILCLGLSHAQSPVNPTFSGEVSKQESIYQSTGAQVPTGYSIDRTLVDYTRGLSSEFDRALADLGAKDRWLDIGAGAAQAILDYYAPEYDLTHPDGWERRGTKAQAVAMSIEDRRTPLWYQTAATLEPNKIRYLINRRLREYSAEELGKFQVITDVIGGFSYTVNLSIFMEKVLALLELNGNFFTLLQDVHSETGANQPHYKGASFLTQITNPQGSEVKICSWLKSISCVDVTCDFIPSWTPPIEAYRVRKVCDEVRVPALVTTHYEAGTPPERRFRSEISSVAAPSPAGTSATP